MSPRSIRCDCGGVATLTTEPIFGRTLETCSGPCGYVGAPRPAVLPPTLDAEPGHPCIEGCGAMTPTARTDRCEACAKRRHSKQAAECERLRRIRVRMQRVS